MSYSKSNAKEIIFVETDRYTYDTGEGFPRNAYSPFDHHTLPTALRHMAHLRDLKELCLDLDYFVTALLIQHIAAVLPHLEILEFSLPRYIFRSDPPRFREQDRDPAFLTALGCFPHLLHLRITMNFLKHSFDLHHSQEVTARWFLASHKTLQTVSFAALQSLHHVGYDYIRWQRWDHEVFHATWPTPPPTPPPSPDYVIVEVDGVQRIEPRYY
ncbi:hypothetical protein R3P38DRAFT_3214317 [Favolaschia claudopus]|uniref:Uncharacterized protein n=1 Tax=Favolaschia claudopus TaxID=2862362 RepID=A0AAW0AB69_9AGAR